MNLIPTTSPLAALREGFQTQDALTANINDRRQEGLVNKLYAQSYGQGPQAQQAALAQAAQAGPGATAALGKAQTGDNTAREQEIVKAARFLHALPETQRAGAYAQIRPQLEQVLGSQLSPEYDEDVDDVVGAVIEAYGSGSGDDLKSLRVGQDGFYYAIRGNQLVNTGIRAADNLRPLDLGANGFVGFDPRTGQAAPVTVGGQQGAAQPSVEAPNGGFGIRETNDYVRKVTDGLNIPQGASRDQVLDAIMPRLIQAESSGDPNAVSPVGAQGLAQVMPATGRDPGFGVAPLRDGSPQENVRFGREYLSAMLDRYNGNVPLALAAYNAGPGVADQFAGGQASAGGGQPIRKVEAITPYQQSQIGATERDDARAERTLQLAEEQAQQKLAEQRREADEAKRGLQRASQGVIDSTNDALATIQRLRGHAGYPALGTPVGDAQLAVPVVRTDAKGAKAILDQVGAQSLINTLSALKAASATGASGFGSLTEKEGAALTAAMGNLTTAQSHDDLDAALSEIERILTRTQGAALDQARARGSQAPAAQTAPNALPPGFSWGD